LVDFTGGEGAEGYTMLSPSHIESAIGAWDSSQALPYLVGRGYVAAQASDDRLIATGDVHRLFLGLVLGGILLAGVIADSCIPMLPKGMPLRDFTVFSSISMARPALLELDAEDHSYRDSKQQGAEPSLRPEGPELRMDSEKLEEKIGKVSLYIPNPPERSTV